MRRRLWRLLLPVATAAVARGLAAAAPDAHGASRGFVEEVVAGGDRVVTDVMTFLAGRRVEVGLVEAVALAVLLAWGVGLWRERKRACDPGSISVEQFVNATGDKEVSAESWTALVEDRLAGGGLLPAPALPSGAMATQFVKVVETSPVPQAKWLGAVIGLIQGLVSRPPRTHKLTGTLRSEVDKEPCGLSVKLFDGRSGQLEGMATFWDTSYREVAESAAGFAYARVMHGVVRCTPRWQTWTNLQGDSVTEYHRGLKCEQALIRGKGTEKRAKVKSTLAKALVHYTSASEREPMNLLVQLRMANLYELGNQWGEALKSYLDAIQRWPSVFDARYRLAITLTFVDGVFKDDSPEQRRARLDRVREVEPKVGLEEILPGSRAELEPFQFVGLRHLDRLYREVGFFHAVRDWLRTWQPSWSGGRERWRERPHFGRLARPWSRQRRERRNVVALARVCTQVQLGIPTTADDVATYLRPWRAKNWQVRYNAACCFSRLFEADGKRQTELVKKAVGQLELAYEKAGGHLELGWIRTDPDLLPIQETDLFGPWRPGGLPTTAAEGILPGIA